MMKVNNPNTASCVALFTEDEFQSVRNIACAEPGRFRNKLNFTLFAVQVPIIQEGDVEMWI